MPSWYVHKSGMNFVLMQNGKISGKIQDIAACKSLGSVNIRLEEDGNLITLPLITYSPAERNDQFISCLMSRTKFVEKWSEISKESDTVCETVEDTTGNLSAEIKENDEQLEDKLAYSYVLVHIKNLKEPAYERKFRDVDQRHVNNLRTKIIQNPDLKCRIMLGNVKENKQCLTEDLLKTPGKVDVEVIGGNHTRTAILQILDDPQYKYDTRYHLWPLKVYCQLERIQAQKLGFDHNIENGCVKPTSAFDILRFARKELLAVTDDTQVYTAPQIKTWKENIIQVLNLTKEDLHNKYKTLVNLAKSPPCVWDKLQQFEEQWQKRAIQGQAPGDIKTGHLKPISLLKEDDQVELLSNLIQKNLTWKEFKELCSRREKNQQTPTNTDNREDQTANSATTATFPPKTDSFTIDIGRAKCKDYKKKLDSALATIRLLTAENENLKCRLSVSENKNRQTEEHLARNQSKNAELCHDIELLKSQKNALEDDVAYYLSKDTLDESNPSSKRKDIPFDSEDEQFTVQHTKKKVMLEAMKNPETRDQENEELQEEVVFVEYTRRRGFLALQSGKSVRYCKTAMCPNICKCPTFKVCPNSLALEGRAYCLDRNYVITKIPNSIINVEGNELKILKDEDVLKDFLMKSITVYLDA